MKPAVLTLYVLLIGGAWLLAGRQVAGGVALAIAMLLLWRASVGEPKSGGPA